MASDRRRAERTATRHGDSLSDDPREAQRARWVRQMQGELMQQQQQKQRAAPTKVGLAVEWPEQLEVLGLNTALVKRGAK